MSIPHNRELEASVLSALIEEGDKTKPIILKSLTPDDFYNYKELAEALWGENTTLPLLIDKLKNTVPASEILKVYNSHKPTTVETREIEVARLKELTAVRKAYLAASHFLKDIEENEWTLESVTSLFNEVGSCINRTNTDTKTMYEVIMEVFDQFDKRLHNKGQVLGVPTGFLRMDYLLSGLAPGRMIVLAARPGKGKTTLALNIARKCAEKVPVYFASAEQSREELGTKLLHAEARVNLQQASMASWDEKEWNALCHKSADIANLPIYIDDKGGMSVEFVVNRAKQLKHEKDIGLVIVDYLQRLKTRQRMKRIEEVGYISRELKDLARSINVPVLALCQLNRDIERREDKVPNLADLKESGDIEQDADQIMFIYEDSNEETHIKIAKNRHGIAGDDIKMRFDKHFGRFAEV